ncbi:AraC-like ligand-binding domain-containing protein [Streptomyces sp. NPDC002519]
MPSHAKREFWNHAVSRTLGPLSVTLKSASSFAGQIASGRLGYVKVATIEADAQRMSRTAAHAASVRTAGDFVSVGLQAQGRSTLVQDGRTALLNPGDMVLYSSARPFTLDQPGTFRMHVFQVPQSVLAVPDRDVRSVTALPLSADEGVAGRLAPLLSMLAESRFSHPAPVSELLGGTVGDLLAALVGERGTARESRCDLDPMTARVREYVSRNLADPDLSPETIAAHLSISVPHLHTIFEGEEHTIERWIQLRRLEECRSELARRGQVSPTVSAVVQRWGFVSPAHFSRAFRAAYGMSLREWRCAVAEQETREAS